MGGRRNTMEKFWTRVDRHGPREPHMPSRCWLWSAGRFASGYGAFNMNNRVLKAHRLAYEDAIGPVGTSLVLHRCDVPACVRPDHLFLGTNADNMADMVRKRRHCHGERNGNAKITWRQVGEIRESYRFRKVTQKMLGARYGLSEQAVYLILHNKNWRSA